MTTLPLAPGTWDLDPAHTGVHFKVRHLGLTNVRGRFNDVQATLVVGETLDDTHFEARIALGSVDTNQPDRDAHLRSTDFFSADQHPDLTFTSTAIRSTGDGGYQADGELSVNGVTKVVTLDVELTGTVVHPGDGKEHAGFAATTEIVRDDFGIDFNMPLGVDRFGLGKKVAIEIDIQFTAPVTQASEPAPEPVAAAGG
jgi:polyisoprenoid-binding protein YceI